MPVRLTGAVVRVRADEGRLLAIMTGHGEIVAEHMLVGPAGAGARRRHWAPPGEAGRYALCSLPSLPATAKTQRWER